MKPQVMASRIPQGLETPKISNPHMEADSAYKYFMWKVNWQLMLSHSKGNIGPWDGTYLPMPENMQ